MIKIVYRFLKNVPRCTLFKTIRLVKLFFFFGQNQIILGAWTEKVVKKEKNTQTLQMSQNFSLNGRKKF